MNTHVCECVLISVRECVSSSILFFNAFFHSLFILFLQNERGRKKEMKRKQVIPFLSVCMRACERILSLVCSCVCALELISSRFRDIIMIFSYNFCYLFVHSAVVDIL